MVTTSISLYHPRTFECCSPESVEMQAQSGSAISFFGDDGESRLPLAGKLIQPVRENGHRTVHEPQVHSRNDGSRQR